MIDRTDMPDAAAIERMAIAAIQRMPPLFRDHLSDVVVRVAEFADKESLRSVGLSDPWRLIGLYRGRPVTRQSIWSSGGAPSVISLFRRPLLNRWRSVGGALEDVVTHVIVHEVGHHFGFSDDDMHRIEDDRS